MTFAKIHYKLMKILRLKLVNVYKDMLARGQAVVNL